MSDHPANRERIRELSQAMYDFDADDVRATLRAVFAADADVHLSHPFEDLDGPDGWFDAAIGPLAAAFPDLERRDTIRMAGDDPYGNGWVGCGGYYTGTWRAPFLGIPATGHQAAMRFHEYYRMVDGHVVEFQGVWDLPELMMQAGVWPMGPSLGREWHVPGPATSDGIREGERDAARSQASVEHVTGMLGDMGKYPAQPADAMRLDHWWHPRFSWYGPSGIGTTRGVDGFRRWHQTPFLNAMPDRSGGYGGESHFFGDGDYVAVTAWPGMRMTLGGDGWLGVAPAGKELTMRSLDFWRLERNLDDTGNERLQIRENWVLVDLLDVWHQLGVDVLARMRELASARP